MTKHKTLIIVLGPTAVGKTALSIEIARHLETEILSADSRQFFKEMNIGTAKPSAQELQQVTHHFIDSISIKENYNAGIYEIEALACLEKIFLKNDYAILTGGSGLYINAVTKGFDKLPEADQQMRENLLKKYKKAGIESLQNELKELDPVYYHQTDLNNPQRIIRALEVCAATGKPYSDYRTGKQKQRSFDIVQVGLNLSREELYQKIDLRVDQMMDQGLENEARLLLHFKDKNALQTVGYKELFDYFEGKYDLDKAIELIKQNTRRFAKRQLTWFLKDTETHWFHPGDLKQIMKLVKREKNV